MKAIVLGADGYLGLPVSLHLANLGFEVHAVDNLSKRHIEAQNCVTPLIPLIAYHQRFASWNKANPNSKIRSYVIDIAKQNRLFYSLIESVVPDIVIHFAEQPSAPFSMKGRTEAVETQINNISGTLNLAFAIKSYCPSCHIIKLGTMGEYGTPNIDIEEGWLNITHNGRTDKVLFPKKPSSFYHLSKVHDSNNLEFVTRNWGLAVTDLNQGIVYGSHTSHTVEYNVPTSFHYDSIFGTAINRFIVQCLLGHPMTLYGSGNQTRAYLHIDDVLECISIAIKNPALPGEFKVRNQFTEYKSIKELASIVAEGCKNSGCPTEPIIQNIDNPRIEEYDHYYNPINSSFIEQGLKPKALSPNVIAEIVNYINPHVGNVDPDVLLPKIHWKNQ